MRTSTTSWYGQGTIQVVLGTRVMDKVVLAAVATEGSVVNPTRGDSLLPFTASVQDATPLLLSIPDDNICYGTRTRRFSVFVVSASASDAVYSPVRVDLAYTIVDNDVPGVNIACFPNGSDPTVAAPVTTMQEGDSLLCEVALATQGGTSVTITGRQLGTARSAVVLTLRNAAASFTTSTCVVATLETVVVCGAPSGVGTNFSVTVTVGGTSSEVFWPAVVLSYGVPTIVSLALTAPPDDPTATVGATSGGSVVLITGTNFGTVAANAVTAVTFTYVCVVAQRDGGWGVSSRVVRVRCGRALLIGL